MDKILPFAIEHDLMAKAWKKTDDQGKMFIEAARELGCHEDEATFDASLRKVAGLKTVLPRDQCFQEADGKVRWKNRDAK